MFPPELVSGWDTSVACSVLLACVLVTLGWLFRLVERRLWRQSSPPGCPARPGLLDPLLVERSMEQILSNLKLLHPDDLREEILKAGLKCGPITSTTRCIFEKKLARTLLEQQGLDVETYRSNDGLATSDHQKDSRGLQAKYSEDRDFGYNVGLNPPIEETISRRDFAASGGSEAAHFSTNVHSDYPSVFYAVCPVYDDTSARTDKTHIYTDKKEALQTVKMLKGSRFKAFQSREDAEKFATGICDYYPSPNKSSMSLSPVKLASGLLRDGLSAPDVESLNKEKANSFKSPRTQDLTAKLRKAVEKGDLATFSDLIWSNPRYLIGSGDNPTVVQEGCRYNVMHVAAKENQAGICQLLLDTLENPEFMRLMYPDDDDEVMLQKRIRYIVDLYLNTPDKMGFDTPLHFACKFGNPDVVNVLCSHPDIIKNPRNKYDQTPEQVICERNKNKSSELKEKIREYLKGHCYVPLLRAEDNSSFPVIGVPWSPEQHDILSQPRHFGSPKDPLLAVRAFAGPMSPSKAEDFRRVWKTPPRDRAVFFHNIRKTDPERGEERVGRELAHELDVPWVEYWEFLGCFADLSSQDGVGKLEEYLSKREISERIQLEHDHEICNMYKTPSPAGKGKNICNSVSVGAFLDDEDDMSLEEIKNRQNAALKNSLPLTSTETFTIPECIMDATPLQSSCHSDGSKQGYCSPLNYKVNVPGEHRRQQCLEEALLSPVSNLMAEFEKLSLSGLKEASNVESPSNNGCAMSQKLSEMTVSDDVVLDSSSPITRTKSSELMQIDHPVPSFSHLDRPLFPGTSNEPSLSNSHSGSPSQQLVMKTPTKPQRNRFLFLLGKEPTKLDSDVLSAIENVEIDAQKFPSVSRWMKSVLFYSSTERQSWPSPAVTSGKSRPHVFGCNSPGGNGFSTPGRSSPILGSPGKYMNTSDYCSPGRYSPAYANHIQLLRLRHFSDHSGL